MHSCCQNTFQESVMQAVSHARCFISCQASRQPHLSSRTVFPCNPCCVHHVTTQCTMRSDCHCAALRLVIAHVTAGAQCNRAAELFEQMQQQGCVPDVVTFTALISAYEKGGQWRRALAAYDLMRQQRCKPDAIVYNAIIDALWETGLIWAQRKALVLYQVPSLTTYVVTLPWPTPPPAPAPPPPPPPSFCGSPTPPPCALM